MSVNPPDPYPVEPLDPFRASITPPGSKSLTNRALLLASLADGVSTIRRPLVADDTQRMIDGLIGLGVRITPDDDGIRIVGSTGRFTGGAALRLGNAGTATRFLTAAACLASGPVTIDGDARMRERPIGQLVDQLRSLGAQINYLGQDGCPPLTITGPEGGLPGGSLTIATTLSSQFISALLQIGPLCPRGLTVDLTGPITSAGYLDMTIALMRRFGAQVHVEHSGARFVVEPVPYTARDDTVEPDASSATYFLAAAAITPGAVCTIEGIGKGSLQGDVGFADVLARMGADLVFGQDFITVTGRPESLAGIDVNMAIMPDAAMTLAAVACFARGETVIRGLRTLRVKETDRLAALATELTKVGAKATIEADDDDELLVIEPPTDVTTLEEVVIETYNDHRMAMSFAVVGLGRPGIVIHDPSCVSKTYPTFWDDLALLRASAIPPS
ncbi:MAG: 3-phosphoshikimate 1-carboxyvinyltransferase [Phycisphaerales bacterium]|nr:3-phosphoshikimate 1-carboxyvinyltransferase [Phycisphaerales bacterium]